jgi:hypothetical protein
VSMSTGRDYFQKTDLLNSRMLEYVYNKVKAIHVHALKSYQDGKYISIYS